MMMFLDIVDEIVSRSVVTSDLARALELLLDGLGQLFAQLDTPLIVRVDVPDAALHEYLVLVDGDESAESERRDLGQQDRVARSVALEHLVRHYLLDLSLIHLGCSHLFGRLLARLASHECLGLRQKVGQQHRVVNAASNLS